MCIVLFTTAHPGYSLILIDNRDEYILRPTSRPSWWKHPTSGDEVLSARDLQRAEKGTWFGISRGGTLAVLTNYRELDLHDVGHPVHGIRSRGRMVTAWLGGMADGGIKEGVHQLVKDGGVAGVGGFSMVSGKLRKKGGGIAIVSNRARQADDVPLVGLERGETWGLSNTVFDDPDEWPKVKTGKHLLSQVVSEAADAKAGQQELIARLFSILDTDTLPLRAPEMGFEEYVSQLKHTIFVPAIGDEAHRQAMREATTKGRGDWAALTGDGKAVEALLAEQRPDANPSPETIAAFETGMYGTQRQTVLLVDWDGHVTLVERALWDSNGNEIPRGQGDVVFRFEIDGWDE
ncbi:transport and golgi organization domain-containing protein [Hirsutella rhossiliensis]|uniref:Transport and golgi organization domain-containing protein n=1 Tax=Hirsutella rhossiliensis TaxID=111463 RepID=A0A9P8SI10_9HYPO|nr:transport and golgi organization domain-containing protein [Hirsutella rhossiliensis]KAH0961536.1 transport and golgi organization domain-containing protein [Hirsutella rhossiliensis]